MDAAVGVNEDATVNVDVDAAVDVAWTLRLTST